MKIHLKIKIIAVVIIVAVLFWYFLIYKKSASGSISDLGGAVDAGDEECAQAMAAAFASSQFAGAFAYVVSEYAKNYAPGKPFQPTDDYSTLAGKPCKSGGLVKAIRNGFTIAYVSNPGDVPPAKPVAGKTQAEATAAQALENQCFAMWVAYKTKYLLG